MNGIMLSTILVLIGMGMTSALAEDEVLSPRQQFLSGVPIAEIECRGTLVLMESPSGKPVCVKFTSVDPLTQRGFMWVDSSLNFITFDWLTEEIAGDYDGNVTAVTLLEALGVDGTFVEELLETQENATMEEP